MIDFKTQLARGLAFSVILAAVAGAQVDPLTTFFGGDSHDRVQGCATDNQGRVYITGNTGSSNFDLLLPHAAGGYKTLSPGGADAFVAILDKNLSAVVAWTYLGGDASDRGYGVLPDAQGRVWVIGFTESSNFPSTNGSVSHGGREVFVARFSPDLKHLQMSTIIGGSGEENGRGSFCLDPQGNVFIGGETASLDFPTTPGAYQTVHHGGVAPFGWDAFLMKLSPTGQILWSTLIGGSGNDAAFSGVERLADGSLITAGVTTSANFPTTPGVFQPNYGGAASPSSFNGDGYVLRMTADGKQLIFSTYLGGSLDDGVSGNDALEVDAAGNLIVIGQTSSPDFPTTPGAYQRTYQNPLELGGFITKLSPDGVQLLASTYFGKGGQEPSGLCADAYGNLFVSGTTASGLFPVTPDADQQAYSGGHSDAFLTKWSPDLKALAHSTLMGGNGNSIYGDRARCLVLSPVTEEVIVCGDTDSDQLDSFPQALLTAYQGGTSDGWVARVQLNGSYSFGDSKQNSVGTAMNLSLLGSPTLSAGSFQVRAVGGVPQRLGVLVAGKMPKVQSVLGGTWYLPVPSPIAGLGKAGATGQITYSLGILPAMLGVTSFYQVLQRDPLHPDGTGASMSNVLKVTFKP